MQGSSTSESCFCQDTADVGTPFLGCRVVYGPEFPVGDDDDWAREILDDPSLDADDKALRLEAQLELLDAAAADDE